LPGKPGKERVDCGEAITYVVSMTDQELRELVASLAADNKETDRQLRDLREQIGGLGNKFGSFTEGLAYPSLYRILTEDFHLDTVAYRVRQRRNGTEQEFDMLGSTNRANQRVFLVEIKSHLTEAELKKFEKKLGEFLKFFPEHRGKALYGLIAAVDVARGLEARAARHLSGLGP
jgi:hypothetical protein